MHLSVVTISSSMQGSLFIPRVMTWCDKPDTIPNLTFREMPLDIDEKLAEQRISRTLNVHIYNQHYCTQSSTHCIGAEEWL